MRARSLFFAATLGLGLGLSAMSPASAGGVDPSSASAVQREQAQNRFLRGKQLFEGRMFEEALAEFRASYDIVASPNTRLYVARSLRELGRVIEAFVEFGRTDVEAREHAAEDARYARAGEAAIAERDAMKKQLGFVTVRIEHAEDSTRLFVGSEEIRHGGWSEPIPVRPGNAEVRVETPGRQTVIGTISVTAGETTEIALDAATGTRAGAAMAAPASERAPAVGRPLPAPREQPESSESPSSLRPYAYVAGGVGVAGLATFTIFGLMAKSTHSDLLARCPAGHCPADYSSDVDKGRSQQTIANVGLVVGAVGLATGVALFVLEPKKRSATGSARATVQVGLGRVDVGGHF